SSRPRATLWPASGGAGSRPLSGGSGARCVARVTARYGIRPTRTHAGRPPHHSGVPRPCLCTTARHDGRLHPARPASHTREVWRAYRRLMTLSLPLTTLARYTTPPARCGYLPTEQASLAYRVLVGVTAAQHEALLARGWRRFGCEWFRPVCPAC